MQGVKNLHLYTIDPTTILAVVELSSSWLAEQEVRVRFPASPLEFSEIGYLLLPSRDMADHEIPLMRRESSIQPTNTTILDSKC